VNRLFFGEAPFSPLFSPPPHCKLRGPLRSVSNASEEALVERTPFFFDKESLPSHPPLPGIGLFPFRMSFSLDKGAFQDRGPLPSRVPVRPFPPQCSPFHIILDKIRPTLVSCASFSPGFSSSPALSLPDVKWVAPLSDRCCFFFFFFGNSLSPPDFPTAILGNLSLFFERDYVLCPLPPWLLSFYFFRSPFLTADGARKPFLKVPSTFPLLFPTTFFSLSPFFCSSAIFLFDLPGCEGVLFGRLVAC